jgi:predicted metal-dependent peptidase
VTEVAIVCDTSGSMHERLLARALGEVEALLTRTGLRHTQVRVLAVDTAVHAARRVSRAAQVFPRIGTNSPAICGFESDTPHW